MRVIIVYNKKDTKYEGGREFHDIMKFYRKDFHNSNASKFYAIFVINCMPHRNLPSYMITNSWQISLEQNFFATQFSRVIILFN